MNHPFLRFNSVFKYIQLQYQKPCFATVTSSLITAINLSIKEHTTALRQYASKEQNNLSLFQVLCEEW